MRDTRLIGIVNVTPDSFSDGGAAFAPEDARMQARRLMEDGAALVDVGAESTRPGAPPLSHAEEWARLEPVLPLLRQDGIPFSIDTRHAATAAKALAYGAQWINDVSGFADPAMANAVRVAKCRLVVMHSLSVPADKTVTWPENIDVIAELLAFAFRRVAALEKAGIAKERMIFDPGIGFGKTAAQSWAIIGRIGELDALGLPLLVGHSRKSFLSQPGDTLEVRDLKTVELSRRLARAGVEYLRVHNVGMHAYGLRGRPQ